MQGSDPEEETITAVEAEAVPAAIRSRYPGDDTPTQAILPRDQLHPLHTVRQDVLRLDEGSDPVRPIVTHCPGRSG